MCIRDRSYIRALTGRNGSLTSLSNIIPSGMQFMPYKKHHTKQQGLQDSTNNYTMNATTFVLCSKAIEVCKIYQIIKTLKYVHQIDVRLCQKICMQVLTNSSMIFMLIGLQFIRNCIRLMKIIHYKPTSRRITSNIFICYYFSSMKYAV